MSSAWKLYFYQHRSLLLERRLIHHRHSNLQPGDSSPTARPSSRAPFHRLRRYQHQHYRVRLVTFRNPAYDPSAIISRTALHQVHRQRRNATHSTRGRRDAVVLQSGTSRGDTAFRCSKATLSAATSAVSYHGRTVQDPSHGSGFSVGLPSARHRRNQALLLDTTICFSLCTKMQSLEASLQTGRDLLMGDVSL